MLNKDQEVCRSEHCGRPCTWGPVSATEEPCLCSVVLQSPLPRICKSGDISYALTFIINVLAQVTALRVHPGGWGAGMAVFPVRRDFRPAGEEKHSRVCHLPRDRDGLAGTQAGMPVRAHGTWGQPSLASGLVQPHPRV